MDHLAGADWLCVNEYLVRYYVLKSGDGLYLVDTGFLGGPKLLRRKLARRGWGDLPIRGMLLTHGHLDHALNAAKLAEETGAWVAAPRKDREYLEGTFTYRGWARVCGWLHKIGHPALGYKVPPVSRWLDEDDGIDIWEGLTAVALPGHTLGHTGYYCAARKLLFCGDLLVSPRRGPYVPPAIFNSHPELIPATLRKAAAMDLAGILPAHGSNSPPAEHVKRLRVLAVRIAR